MLEVGLRGRGLARFGCERVHRENRRSDQGHPLRQQAAQTLECQQDRGYVQKGR